MRQATKTERKICGLDLEPHPKWLRGEWGIGYGREGFVGPPVEGEIWEVIMISGQGHIPVRKVEHAIEADRDAQHNTGANNTAVR